MHKWCIVTRGHLRLGIDPGNLGLCDAGGQNNGSTIKHTREKGTSRTHITKQNTITQYGSPGFWRFLLSFLNIFFGISNIIETNRNTQCCVLLPLIRLVGWGKSIAGCALYIVGLLWKPLAHPAYIIKALKNEYYLPVQCNSYTSWCYATCVLHGYSFRNTTHTALSKLKAWPWKKHNSPAQYYSPQQKVSNKSTYISSPRRMERAWQTANQMEIVSHRS